MENVIPCTPEDQEVFQRVWQRVMGGRSPQQQQERQEQLQQPAMQQQQAPQQQASPLSMPPELEGDLPRARAEQILEAARQAGADSAAGSLFAEGAGKLPSSQSDQEAEAAAEAPGEAAAGAGAVSAAGNSVGKAGTRSLEEFWNLSRSLEEPYIPAPEQSMRPAASSQTHMAAGSSGREAAGFQSGKSVQAFPQAQAVSVSAGADAAEPSPAPASAAAAAPATAPKLRNAVQGMEPGEGSPASDISASAGSMEEREACTGEQAVPNPAPGSTGPVEAAEAPAGGRCRGGDMPRLWEQPQEAADCTCRLRRQVMEALEGWQFYRYLARRARGGDARTLNTLAGEEHRAAQKLSAAYFLATGLRYWPSELLAAPAVSSYWGALRKRYQAEQKKETDYSLSGDDWQDPAMTALYQELAAVCQNHCKQLRALLEADHTV